MKTALILYPNQLYPIQALPEVDTVIMVEEPLYFGVDAQFPLRLHKQKIILHRASMRRYVDEVLWAAKIDVDYVNLDVFMNSADVLDRARKFDKVYVFDPVDDVLTKRLLAGRRERSEGAELEFLETPNFYLKNQEVRQYFEGKHKHLFTDFYQWQRERFNILIDENYQPVGGKWSFESEGHKKLPKDHVPASFGVFGSNKYVEEATKFVNEHFPNNPGGTDFIWPTNHAEAEQWLEDFAANRLDLFGAYEDAIDSRAAWIYHSTLSSSLNTGLLSPQQVVDAVLRRHKERPVELTSLEPFIRQVLGWREFIRGEYVYQGDKMRGQNPLKHHRKMTPAWYSGSLDIPPFSDLVKKVSDHAYAHQSERAALAGNLMLLCEISPEEIYKWFGELFIDAYDWIMTPNVYNISQLIEDGAAIKPVVSDSGHIMKLSNYEKGYWCDVWDGLYWRFIEKNQAQLKQNPHFRPVINQLNQLDPDHKRIISYRAEDFLNKYTIL